MNTYEFDKYITNIDNIKDKLNEFGVCIIPNVLNNDECNIMIDNMWNYLEHITQKFIKPINRNDNTSWREFRKLYPKHSMLLQNWNIGHSELVWNVRQNKKIINIFKKFYDTDELLVSFDGASFHFPPEITKIGWFRDLWFHCDQSFLRNDFELVQGWINAYDTNIGDATLCILEKSHLYHKDFKDKYNKSDIFKQDWYKLSDDEKLFFIDKGCQEKRILAPRGSLILWDSRTIHCGVEPIKGRPQMNHRCCVYLCYQPKFLCKEKDIQKRIKAYENLRTTSHNVCKPKLFAINPRTYGGDLPDITQINKPNINYIGKQLIGYKLDRYETGDKNLKKIFNQHTSSQKSFKTLSLDKLMMKVDDIISTWNYQDELNKINNLFK